MKILVTGASGFAGSLLIPRLLEEGHEVHALAREPSRAREALARSPTLEQLQIHRGDTLSGEGLARALVGMEVAYYLIHSMETIPSSSGFPERERRSARNFAEAASAADLARIVYLGGLMPGGEPPSRHLASRREVERILLDAVPGSVALRGSIVIGARSRSFRLMVRLIERLPVLALPAWRVHRTQPIDERDLVELLAVAASAGQVAGRTLDVGGPDALTYEQMLERIAELMLLGRPTLKLKVTLTPIAARLAAVLASEDPELILPLMEGLEGDLLPAPKDLALARTMGVELHSFDAAVEHALREWERVEPLLAR
jgi:uncharacterized protein YbjT (DUF2867 family)